MEQRKQWKQQQKGDLNKDQIRTKIRGGREGWWRTCFSCVFHGGLVGWLHAELLQHQLLVLRGNQSLLVCYIHRWLVRRGTFWVRGRPALRPVAPCGNKASRRSGKKKCWQDLRILLSEIIAPTVRDAHHCCCTGRWFLICACGNFRENNDSQF